MRYLIILLTTSLLFWTPGCADKPVDPGDSRPVARGPQKPYPPLDPALHAAADRVLSEMTRSSDPILRVHALEGIQDSNGTSHKEEILQALNDKEARVRFAAALAAGQLQIHEAQWPLLAIAEDPSENVRVAVRFALHKLGYKELSHDLEKMAADPSALVRGNTAFVLGLLGEKSAAKILRVLLDDPEAPVREQAAEALWRLQLDDEAGLKELIGLTLSSHPDDEMIGYLALAQPRNTRVRQHIRPGLRGIAANNPDLDKDLEKIYDKYGSKWALTVPLVAARAMGMLGSDEGVVIAVHGAYSPDPQLRMLAALAFGAIGRPDTQQVLKMLLDDKDASVRIAAATAILQLKPPGELPF
ncbi:MAG TPA: HEAT repeat domain-containing protein [Tepidisphaeraceae bacterium]|jgi:HEAT repeat protein|nr:HEAT repeat domain-containing protein [Tepidisphaeraceae bacterium]